MKTLLLTLLLFLIFNITLFAQEKINTKINIPEWIESMIGYYDIYKHSIKNDSVLVKMEYFNSEGELITRMVKRLKEPTFDGYVEWLQKVSTYYEHGNKKFDE